MNASDIQNTVSLISSISSLISSCFSLIISIWTIVCMWRLFTKAGEAGWKSIIPFYNTYIMFQLFTGNGWYMFLMLVPVLNIVVAVMLCIRIAQCMGKGIGMGILNIFFQPIVLGILAFGSAEYDSSEARLF